MPRQAIPACSPAPAFRGWPPANSTTCTDTKRRPLWAASCVCDPDDARVARLRSSAKGSAILRRGRELRIGELERRLRTLSAADLRTLDDAALIIERVVRE